MLRDLWIILKTKTQNIYKPVTQIHCWTHCDANEQVSFDVSTFSIVHSIFYFNISDYDTDEETSSPAKKSGRKPAKVKHEPVSQDDSLMLDTGDDILPSTGKR